MQLPRIHALAAVLALLTEGAAARHQPSDHLHRLLKARQHVEEHNATISTRGSGSGKKCSFPSDVSDLVAVATDMKNAGWAIAPDIECLAGMYCPYACPPGKVMAQWKKGSTYTYPESMDGGLFCDEDGVAKKPFEDDPYCVDGTGTVQAVNEASKGLSFCQTTLPGDESMVIPTYVGAGSTVTLAVPDTSYWCETAAHYYINPPGVGVEGCLWGDKSHPIGNWAAYVAGANTDSKGQTFVKIGWNPVFFEEASLMANTPTYGVKIECDDDAGCNGLPCAIDPSKGDLNDVTSNNAASGAGGGDFCVVTVPKGQKASIVVFDTGASSYGTESVDKDDKDDKDDDEDKTTEKATPTPKPSSTKAPEPTTTTKAPEPTSTQEAETTVSAYDEPQSSTTVRRASSSTASTKKPLVTPGIFHENSSSGTDSDDDDDGDDVSSSSVDSPTTGSSDSSADSAPTESSDEGIGSRPQGSAAAGLLVAFVALVYLL